MISRVRLNCRGLLAGLLVLALTIPAGAAPSGPPIRIGGTLALTGPLAPTALLHKIAGEIYVDELNKANGLLGRPVEWVLLDDQSKPDLTRSLYEKLITVDKVDLLIGPYATSGILAAMSVAQRYQKVYIHHSFGMPHLAKYEMHFPTAAFGPEPNVTVAHHGLQRAGRHGQSAQDGGDRHQQVPLGAVPVGRRQGSGREARPEGRALPRVRVRHARLGRAWPRGSRTPSPISSGSARSASTATRSWRR